MQEAGEGRGFCTQIRPPQAPGSSHTRVPLFTVTERQLLPWTTHSELKSRSLRADERLTRVTNEHES